MHRRPSSFRLCDRRTRKAFSVARPPRPVDASGFRKELAVLRRGGPLPPGEGGRRPGEGLSISALRSFRSYAFIDIVMNPVNPPIAQSRQVRVVLSTTALLSFMSVSKATALVLAELGVGMFFAVGVARSFIGESAPWFVMA